MTDNKPNTFIFYLMGLLFTVLFIISLIAKGGLTFLSQTQVFFPAIAEQLQLPNAATIDHFLTTTPYPISLTQRLLNNFPLLVALAFISISYFNLSKLALTSTAVLAQMLQWWLIVVTITLASIILFTSTSMVEVITALGVLILFILPFLLATHLTFKISRQQRFWTIANYYQPDTAFYQQWPSLILTLLIFIVLLLIQCIMMILTKDRALFYYLVAFFTLLNSWDNVVIDITKLEKLFLLFQVWSALKILILAVLLFVILRWRSVIAVAIAFMLITCQHLIFVPVFIPVIKQIAMALSLPPDTTIRLIQAVLFFVVVMGAILFYLLKHYQNELKQWQDASQKTQLMKQTDDTKTRSNND